MPPPLFPTLFPQYINPCVAETRRGNFHSLLDVHACVFDIYILSFLNFKIFILLVTCTVVCLINSTGREIRYQRSEELCDVVCMCVWKVNRIIGLVYLGCIFGHLGDHFQPFSHASRPNIAAESIFACEEFSNMGVIAKFRRINFRRVVVSLSKRIVFVRSPRTIPPEPDVPLRPEVEWSQLNSGSNSQWLPLKNGVLSLPA